MNRIYRFVVIFMVCLSMLGVLGCKQKDDILLERNELAALNLGSRIQSTFFLGCGSIRGRSVIHYVKKFSDGGHQISSSYVSQSIIYEDIVLPQQPYYEKYKHWNHRYGWCRIYDFHVPAGTVSHDFSIDLNDLKGEG